MTDDLRSVPLARLELMDAAGRELAAAERALERQGFNVVGRLLRDEGTFYEPDLEGNWAKRHRYAISQHSEGVV